MLHLYAGTLRRLEADPAYNYVMGSEVPLQEQIAFILNVARKFASAAAVNYELSRRESFSLPTGTEPINGVAPHFQKVAVSLQGLIERSYSAQGHQQLAKMLDDTRQLQEGGYRRIRTTLP